MSFPALLWALGFDKKCKGKVSKPTNLSAPEKAVLICLADHHNQTTGECFPSFNRIARETRLCVRTAKTAVCQLEEKGFIEIISGSAGGCRVSNR
jgi:DNA-binding MarR family transcriptional regulator